MQQDASAEPTQPVRAEPMQQTVSAEPTQESVGAEPTKQSISAGPYQQSVIETSHSEAKELLKEYFRDAWDKHTLHSFYTCSGKCSKIPEHEVQRINSQKKKNMFKHSWLTDKQTSYCEKSGIWWLIYIEGQGMFCLLCRTHNSVNKYNKLDTFNTSPSINYKRSAINEHQNCIGHGNTIKYELERRTSSLAREHKKVVETKDMVTYNAFLSAYWLSKEEMPNKKLLSLIELEKQIGASEMNHFKNTSERSQKDMRLLLGQLLKSNLILKVKRSKWFSILVDEVTDCATMEQLLIYVGYVDVEGISHFDFLEIKDVLENSDSPNSETIFNIIAEELRSCGLNVNYLCGFGSDGASVMTGSKNGVGVRLQQLSSVMLRSHCISHRLALACGDSNESVKYVTTVEVILRQLWKWLEYPKRCTAFVKVCQALNNIEKAKNPDKNERIHNRLAVKIQKACRTRWLSTGQSVASVIRNFVALMLTLRQFKELDATVSGLLIRMNNVKFLGTLMLLNMILPHLNKLSKNFQKDHVCFMSIQPALQATKWQLENIRKSVNIVDEVECVIRPEEVFGQLELSLSENHPVKNFLRNLQNNYIQALEHNLDRRFSEASPVLDAFSVFDPTRLPKKEENTFISYGQDQINILCEQFKFNQEETLAQWQNFKYQLAEWQVPDNILLGEGAISPTQYVLSKLLREQASHRLNFHYLVDAAQICLTQPLSNAVVERGASAVKRVKTRLRSMLKNDMLSSLLHVTLNGAPHRSSECAQLLQEATQIWRRTHVRNLPPLKNLPRIGGLDHIKKTSSLTINS